LLPDEGGWKRDEYIRLSNDPAGATYTAYSVTKQEGQVTLHEAQALTRKADASLWVDGVPMGKGEGERLLHPVGHLSKLPDGTAIHGSHWPH
jgi:cation/acetate symporter